VNGWSRFTVTYPKDWAERRTVLFEVRAGSPRGLNECRINVYSWPVPLPLPLDQTADEWVQGMKGWGVSDVTVVSDKPAQSRDGTPARETVHRLVFNGEPVNVLDLVTRKGDLLVRIMVGWDPRAGTGEHLKAVRSSLQFEPEKDKPVKVPPDVQESLKGHCGAVVANDVPGLMARYSDRFLGSGSRRKKEMEFLFSGSSE
jgi:hypothetical protein